MENLSLANKELFEEVRSLDPVVVDRAMYEAGLIEPLQMGDPRLKDPAPEALDEESS